MAFQTVPPQSELQAAIPAGRMAVAIRPYAKPAPAFGPGSARQHEEEELLEQDGHEATNAPPQATPLGNYAGAGSYY